MMWILAMWILAMPILAMPILAMPILVMPILVMPILVMPILATSIQEVDQMTLKSEVTTNVADLDAENEVAEIGLVRRPSRAKTSRRKC